MAPRGGGLTDGPVEAVLFDYGSTLYEFVWERSMYVRGAAAMLAELGAAEIGPENLERAFWPLFEAAQREAGGAELDYRTLVGDALSAVGVRARGERLTRALRAEHRTWDACRRLHPDAHALLDGLRRRGFRTGLVADTFDPPSLLREDLRLMALDDRLDVTVLSSEVGWRKPHPAIFARALDQVGAEPSRVLFVGDRVAVDIEGAQALGMATCLATWFRLDDGDLSIADAVAGVPLDVLDAARVMLLREG